MPTSSRLFLSFPGGSVIIVGAGSSRPFVQGVVYSRANGVRPPCCIWVVDVMRATGDGRPYRAMCGYTWFFVGDAPLRIPHDFLTFFYIWRDAQGRVPYSDCSALYPLFQRGWRPIGRRVFTNGRAMRVPTTTFGTNGNGRQIAAPTSNSHYTANFLQYLSPLRFL